MTIIGRRTLRRIAQLYYLENLNLRQISQRLGVSTATVSRYLTKARETGIVTITVESDGTGYADLESELERRFSLRECFVTDGAESAETRYREFTGPVAELIFRHTPERGLLGVSWGETLGTIGRTMPRDPQKQIDVVPIVGAFGTIETGVFPNGIAHTFAEATGGQAFLVNTPAVLGSPETLEQVTRERPFQSVRDLWKRIDTVVLGASSLNYETSMVKSNTFTTVDIDSMRSAGCVAAANFIMMDAEGKAIDHPLKNRIVHVSEEYLRDIQTVILVAGGPHKAKPIKTVLKSGMAHCLVTDAETAERIIALG